MRTYSATPATRALTPTGGFLDGFSYSLNPYVGCAFGDNGGCPFCYVRALPVARAQAGPWGTWVVAKSNLLELLARELGALEKSGKLERAAVFMSSATDPYQGMERRMRLTRGALELFVRRPPRRVLLQTRSPMIERDLDLLTRLGPAAHRVDNRGDRRRAGAPRAHADLAVDRAAARNGVPAARGRRVRAARDRSDDAEPSRAPR